MNVLVAFECSGLVRDAFAEKGHNAWSCDLKPSEAPGQHIQGDAMSIISMPGWDLIIAHPPCTYLCSSGLHWNDRGRGWAETNRALLMVLQIMRASADMIAIENPIGIISRWEKPTQIIQPHQFGHNASKATCLWLKNLSALAPTKHIEPRMVNGKKRWGNQTDSGQNNLGPGENRSSDRSRTYPGVARAMAETWSR